MNEQPIGVRATVQRPQGNTNCKCLQCRIDRGIIAASLFLMLACGIGAWFGPAWWRALQLSGFILSAVWLFGFSFGRVRGFRRGLHQGAQIGLEHGVQLGVTMTNSLWSRAFAESEAETERDSADWWKSGGGVIPNFNHA